MQRLAGTCKWSYAAQEPFTTIPKTSTGNYITTIREAVNTNFGTQHAMNTELYAHIADGNPWVAQATAPADTTKLWFDTDDQPGYVVLKIYTGGVWVAHKIGGSDYTLPTAAADTLGGVKVGSRLSITDGVLSADVQTTDAEKIKLSNLSGVNTGDQVNITGNAGSATILQTARTIGGVSFNGSANISLPGVNTSGNQNTSGNAATATALAANPTDCTTGQYANAIGANGNLTCGQVAYSQVSGTPSIPTISDTAYDATSWNGDTGAASKNSIRDKIESLVLGVSQTYPSAGIAFSTGSAWGTSLTLDTDLASVSASDDSTPSAKATKIALDLKANSTGTSFIASALSDIKYDPNTSVSGDEYPLITNTGSVGDANDATVVPTLERAGALFQAADADLTYDALEFVFDGGGSAIAASKTVRLVAPWSATVTSVKAYCSPSGSITWGIAKATDANFPTMTSIVASAPPVVSSSQKITPNALTGWTTAISKGDVFEATTQATPATVTNCTLVLEVTK